MYVLGTLAPQEKQEVEQLILQYPEIAEEVRAIEDALETLSENASVTPSFSVKSELLSKLDSVPVSNSASPNDAPMLPIPFIWVLLTFLGLGLSTYFYFENRRIKINIDTVQQTNSDLQANLDSIITTYSTQLKSCSDLILMLGNNPRGEQYAGIIQKINAEKAIFLSCQMPALPPGKDFQLWSIKGNAPPTPMGILSTPEFINSGRTPIDISQSLDADIFAITIEDKGGSPSGEPTLPIIILGNNS